MKIQKFKKINDDMYELFLENNNVLTLHEDAILKYELLITKTIDEELLNKLTKENDILCVYNLCIKYISYKMRYKNEVIEYLKNKCINNEIISKVILMLEQKGYINDKKYAEYYIKDQFNLSNNGPLKIKKVLISYGIDEIIIDNNIDNIEKNKVEEKLKKLINKKLSLTNGSKKEVENKMVNYFYNLGYDLNMIQDIVQQINIKTDINKLSKEYNLLIKKYSKKYDGNQLNYFVTNKLLSKGYTKEELNSIKS